MPGPFICEVLISPTPPWSPSDNSILGAATPSSMTIAGALPPMTMHLLPTHHGPTRSQIWHRRRHLRRRPPGIHIHPIERRPGLGRFSRGIHRYPFCDAADTTVRPDTPRERGRVCASAPVLARAPCRRASSRIAGVACGGDSIPRRNAKPGCAAAALLSAGNGADGTTAARARTYPYCVLTALRGVCASSPRLRRFQNFADRLGAESPAPICLPPALSTSSPCISIFLSARLGAGIYLERGRCWWTSGSRRNGGSDGRGGQDRADCGRDAARRGGTRTRRQRGKAPCARPRAHTSSGRSERDSSASVSPDHLLSFRHRPISAPHRDACAPPPCAPSAISAAAFLPAPVCLLVTMTPSTRVWYCTCAMRVTRRHSLRRTAESHFSLARSSQSPLASASSPPPAPSRGSSHSCPTRWVWGEKWMRGRTLWSGSETDIDPPAARGLRARGGIVRGRRRRALLPSALYREPDSRAPPLRGRPLQEASASVSPGDYLPTPASAPAVRRAPPLYRAVPCLYLSPALSLTSPGRR
ncbi:hypothetical protein DFH07DRAFT_958312 [Mycena maculata]|uniref:Uncharacterized protein n=1 Tax=Mycena maculata TaxID=230809 RepID=A0AAD7J6X7_9AGAR|nr:hypothetical protein DFH07DRAFT_958312 [Mycena maculata]